MADSPETGMEPQPAPVVTCTDTLLSDVTVYRFLALHLATLVPHIQSIKPGVVSDETGEGKRFWSVGGEFDLEAVSRAVVL